MWTELLGVAQAGTDTYGLAGPINGFSGSALALAGAVVTIAIIFHAIAYLVRHRIEGVAETLIIVSVAVALILAATRIGAAVTGAAGATGAAAELGRAWADVGYGWLVSLGYAWPGWRACRWWQGRSRP